MNRHPLERSRNGLKLCHQAQGQSTVALYCSTSAFISSPSQQPVDLDPRMMATANYLTDRIMASVRRTLQEHQSSMNTTMHRMSDELDQRFAGGSEFQRLEERVDELAMAANSQRTAGRASSHVTHGARPLAETPSHRTQEPDQVDDGDYYSQARQLRYPRSRLDYPEPINLRGPEMPWPSQALAPEPTTSTNRGPSVSYLSEIQSADPKHRQLTSYRRYRLHSRAEFATTFDRGMAGKWRRNMSNNMEYALFSGAKPIFLVRFLDTFVEQANADHIPEFIEVKLVAEFL